MVISYSTILGSKIEIANGTPYYPNAFQLFDVPYLSSQWRRAVKAEHASNFQHGNVQHRYKPKRRKHYDETGQLLHSTDIPGPRQRRPGGRGNQRLIDINEAGNRCGWTHTWLRSNQPQAVVLTPSDVPPPSHFFYPVLSLFPRRPSFKDPHHLDVVTFSWVPHFPTIPFLRVFPLISFKISHPRENQAFPKHFPHCFNPPQALHKCKKKQNSEENLNYFSFVVQIIQIY